ncbi:hypothetical protein CFII64_29299 [Pseudomonas sp. CFII64]|nr:hypothetical protein CFII64_29299 [Pseudomonas sp. CFII64]
MTFVELRLFNSSGERGLINRDKLAGSGFIGVAVLVASFSICEKGIDSVTGDCPRATGADFAITVA